MNALPRHKINAKEVMRRCPSPRGRMAIALHTDDGAARNALRRLQPHTDRGQPAGRHLAWVFRAAIAAENFEISDVADYWHVFFLRMKRDGTGRLIVDGTCGAHVNAFNSRLPRPPPPPAMMRIGTIIIMLLDGDVFGVDDIRTAFPQFELCAVMRRALGVAVILESGAVMRGNVARMIQGGTWSAVTCQYTSLECALSQSQLPARAAAQVTPQQWIHQRPTGVDYVSACIRARRMVHVDDIMSGGADRTKVDAERMEFRRRAEQAFGVQWKPFVPAAPRGRAVGIDLCCQTKTWSVCGEWAQKVHRSLRNMEGQENWDERDVMWVAGVSEWVAQVLHLPGVVSAFARGTRTQRRNAAQLLTEQVMSRATMRRLRRPEWMLRPWPRDGVRNVVISDACGSGWAASASVKRYAACGRWYRCNTYGVISPIRCCDGTMEAYVQPAEMYIAEAMASVEGIVGGRDEAAGDQLVLTDSKIWADALAANHSTDETLRALLVMVSVSALGQCAVAHIEGAHNPMDVPSRDLVARAVDIADIPMDHVGTVRWSQSGLARVCERTLRLMVEMVAHSLPCMWAQRAQDFLHGGCTPLCSHEQT